jgi:fermentation-respiration switch protein FrsA (DUF1100 family)
MIHRTILPFYRGNIRLVGELFRNTDRFDVRQPGIVITGSWLTVKEQMPEVYALRFAERGYTAFTFDFAGFGQSGGEPRQAELPHRKIADIIAATEFLSTLALIEPDTLTHMAVCATSQYALTALAQGSLAKRFVSIAGWYHDPVSVAPFYGGADGMASRLQIADRAIDRFLTTGTVEMVPAYKAGDTSAAMFIEMDYYGNARRGAVPSWKNEMAAMSWYYWLLFDGTSAARQVEVPTLLVHSDGSVFPDNVRLVHSQLRGKKELIWTNGFQTDFYDQPTQVAFAVDAADAFITGIVD